MKRDFSSFLISLCCVPALLKQEPRRLQSKRVCLAPSPVGLVLHVGQTCRILNGEEGIFSFVFWFPEVSQYLTRWEEAQFSEVWSGSGPPESGGVDQFKLLFTSFCNSSLYNLNVQNGNKPQNELLCDSLLF